jgi:Lycopene cyclase
MPTVDPSFRYVWPIWASVFLLPWTVLFVAWRRLRRPMLWASALTAPFGLTEFLFVPRYWNPPSLFDLAHRTGFDIESFIFCFAIGGLGVAGYRVLAPASEHALAPPARKSHLHRWHRAALVSPFVVFGVLLMLPWNPIYPGIAALFIGALGSGLCRPDLWRNTLVGGVVFLALYAVFLLGLKSLWPGYIEAVWNLSDLIAWRPAGLPLEELLFGFGFGMYWSSVYEHVAWRQRDASPHPMITVNGGHAR